MPKFQKGYDIPKTMWYAGKELEFVIEVNTNDQAQALLDSYRNNGNAAACKHLGDKHQVYREK